MNLRQTLKRETAVSTCSADLIIAFLGLAKRAGKDVQFGAVLGDSSTSDANAPAVEQLDDSLVGERVLLLFDHFLDHVLDGQGRGEEVTE